MIRNSPDVIVEAVCRLAVPFIQLFGLYVIAHGHYSPGGGFQGGVIIASTVILLVLAFGWHEAFARMSERSNVMLAAAGVMIYVLTGVLCMVMGGNFLDYAALAPLFGTDVAYAHYHGMAIVEFGVGIAVMAIMISLFLDLITGGRHEEALGEERGIVSERGRAGEPTRAQGGQ